MVDGFEYECVEFQSLHAFERHLQSQEDIGQTLNANADGTVTHVRTTGFFYGVEILVDNSIEILSDDLSDFMQLLEVELSILYVLGQRDRSQIADGNFVGICVLNDFTAQVRRLDCSQMLVVRLVVAVVLV